MNHSALAATSAKKPVLKAFYKVSDPMKLCIRITDKEDGSIILPGAQCGKCSEVCNTGVITEDARGVYRLNKKECAGCLMCWILSGECYGTV